MSTHNERRNYDNFTADELRQAAQRISRDLARGVEMAGGGGLNPRGVESQQDLQKWMRNEAARRDKA